MRLIGRDSSTNKTISKRFVLGFAALASAAVVGTAGFVGAAANKPPDSFCQQGGFKNPGQCQAAWVHQNHPGQGQGQGNGNGYGGGNGNDISTEVDVDADIDGDNNVINIVINYIFG
jgi:hypothetical protein